MVGGGKAGQAQLVIAGVAAQLARAVADEFGAALTERAVQLPRLAEAAAAHAAAQNLHAGAVLHGAHQRHHKVCGRGEIVHILHDGLGHGGGHAGAVGGDGFNAPVLFVRYIVKRRHIHAGQLGKLQQKLLLVPVLLFAGLDGGADILQHLLALAQLHHVKEIRHRLGIADARPAGDDQRPALVTVSGAQRDARQAQHGEDVGVAKLVFQGKADDVKLGQRVLAFKAVQGQPQALHLLFHIGPGHERALAPPVFVAVEQLVQNFFAQKGHTDLVGIREAERHTDIDLGLIFIGTARFTAGVTAGLLHKA